MHSCNTTQVFVLGIVTASDLENQLSFHFIFIARRVVLSFQGFNYHIGQSLEMSKFHKYEVEFRIHNKIKFSFSEYV